MRIYTIKEAKFRGVRIELIYRYQEIKNHFCKLIEMRNMFEKNNIGKETRLEVKNKMHELCNQLTEKEVEFHEKHTIKVIDGDFYVNKKS